VFILDGRVPDEGGCVELGDGPRPRCGLLRCCAAISPRPGPGPPLPWRWPACWCLRTPHPPSAPTPLTPTRAGPRAGITRIGQSLRRHLIQRRRLHRLMARHLAAGPPRSEMMQTRTALGWSYGLRQTQMINQGRAPRSSAFPPPARRAAAGPLAVAVVAEALGLSGVDSPTVRCWYVRRDRRGRTGCDRGTSHRGTGARATLGVIPVIARLIVDWDVP